MPKGTKELINDFIASHQITGNPSKVRNPSYLHPSSNCFCVVISRPEAPSAECWVYTGQIQEEMDLASALWMLSDDADNGEWADYTRWLSEGNDFYVKELGEEAAKWLFQEQREHFLGIQQVLGDDLMRELNDLIRNGEYRENQKEKQA